MTIKELTNNVEEAIRSEYAVENFLDEKIDFSITRSNDYEPLEGLSYDLKYSNEETVARFKLKIEFENNIIDTVSTRGESFAKINLYEVSGCRDKYPYFGYNSIDDPIPIIERYCNGDNFRSLLCTKTLVLGNYNKEHLLKDILLYTFRYHKKPKPITDFHFRDNILKKIKDRDESIYYALNKTPTSIRRDTKELVFKLAKYTVYSDHYHANPISEFGLSFSFDYEDPEGDFSLLNVVSYKDYDKKVKFKIDELPAERYIIFTVEELIRLEEETFNKIMGEVEYYLNI